MRDRHCGDRCEHRSEMKRLTRNLWNVMKHCKLTLWVLWDEYRQLTKTPGGYSSDPCVSTPSAKNAGESQMHRNEVPQCVCGRKLVFPSQMTQRGCCCCATHPSVSWPNRNIRLWRCSYASITEIKLSPSVCPGSHVDVCFPASCSLCEPACAKEQGSSTEQDFATEAFKEHRESSAQTSFLFLGMKLLANPDCIPMEHACMYNTKLLLQQLFLKVITVETEERDSLSDHLALGGM